MKDEMKRDIAVLKMDVSCLKADVSSLKTDVSGLKTDFGDMRSVMRTMAAAIVRIDSKLGEMTSYMAEKFVTRDEFHTRMDAFSAKLEDSRFRWSVHADTLAQHDKRITRLEDRRP